jgi:hypothetical protein
VFLLATRYAHCEVEREGNKRNPRNENGKQCFAGAEGEAFPYKGSVPDR